MKSGPAFPEALHVSRELGIDISAHRSRSLDGVDLSAADLVIGFERDHAAMAVIDAGADRRRTFLLAELARYLEQLQLRPDPDVVERASRAVQEAAVLRIQLGMPPAEEILDPYGGSDRDYRQAGARIADLTSRLTRILFMPNQER